MKILDFAIEPLDFVTKLQEAAVARPRAAPVVSAKAVAYLNQRRVPAPAFTTAGAEANADAYEAATWQGEIESEDV